MSSCSLVGLKDSDDSEVQLSGYKKIEQEDYVAHFKSFEKAYLANPDVEKVALTKNSESYLKSIADTAIENNELFFSNRGETRFHVIKSNVPFHFSLPGREIFFSSNLLEKYINNETMLFCMIVFELIRSEKFVYEKQLIVPASTLSTSRVLSLLRLETGEKVEIHKWAFYILKRVGIDTDSYLSWLQIKNRNSLDFAMQIGDVQSISREEALFKSFLIQEVKNTKKNIKYKGSSRSFYSFLRNVKG